MLKCTGVKILKLSSLSSAHQEEKVTFFLPLGEVFFSPKMIEYDFF